MKVRQSVFLYNCQDLTKLLTGKEKDVYDIADVLLDVDDWTGLAIQLEVKARRIRDNCKDGSGQDVAKCYRRGVVREFCNTNGLEVEEAVEKIAQALELIGNKKQANILRKKYISSGKGTGKSVIPKMLIFNYFSDTGTTPPPSSKNLTFVLPQGPELEPEFSTTCGKKWELNSQTSCLIISMQILSDCTFGSSSGTSILEKWLHTDIGLLARDVPSHLFSKKLIALR